MKAKMNELSAFVAVATHLSFQKAAIERGVTRSAVSHAVKTLEQHLGVRLLNRNTKAVTLTEPGEELLQRLKPAFEEVTNALEDLNKFRGTPSGMVKLTVPRAVAHLVLGDVLDKLLRENPGLSVDVSCDDNLVDIVAAGFDAGIRFGRSLRPDMIAVPLKHVLKFVVVGSPNYFQKRDIPKAPEDLLAHSCIRYRLPSGAVFAWGFARGKEQFSVEVNGRLTLDDQRMMVESALAGSGLALVFADLVKTQIESGQLVRCLKGWTCSIGDLYVYYSTRRHVSAALRALINALRE
ncbi:LysR family transcriptional regulator [Pseudomonas sp. S191]|uniref:LysR family transcriptional regulator n=1 Tax=Pseudomonas sp. S191 TaxID=579575 RepID=UPI00387B6DD5